MKMMATMKSLALCALFLVGCSSDESATDSPDAASSSASPDAGTITSDCDSAGTEIEIAVCAANEFLGTLTSDEKIAANLSFDDTTDRTHWSNLPGVSRPGVKMGDLSSASQTAALALMSTVLSDAGISDLTGVRAADDYLSANGGGSGYGSGNYLVAIFGTPSTTETWEVMFGGHHMAYNVTFVGGVGYPTPNHLGVEPKAAFTQNGTSYQPMADEGAAMVGIYSSMTADELSTAFLQGQTYTDVLIGPVEYGTGSSAAAVAKYPTTRTGVLVSDLTTDQQALVTTAISAWVADYDPAIADALLAEYTSSAAYADTYVSWAGTESAGVDVDVSGTYMRIDGPRVWIEVACQQGVVFRTTTHYHSIYRDKQFDYAGTL